MKFFHDTFRHIQTKPEAQKSFLIALENNSMRTLKLIRKKRYREALKHLEICEVYKLHYNSLPEFKPNIGSPFSGRQQLPPGDRD